MNQKLMRAKFELWREMNYAITDFTLRESGAYKNTLVQMQWRAFQAGFLA